jgi:DNA-binding transcriptional MocR family regulator
MDTIGTMAQARYKQLVDALAARSAAAGCRRALACPPTGNLPRAKGLALVTATRVYAELERHGPGQRRNGPGHLRARTSLPRGLGIDQQAVAPDLVDLNFNYPALPGQADCCATPCASLPLGGDLEALLRYQPHGGRPHERESVARHLGAAAGR